MKLAPVVIKAAKLVYLQDWTNYKWEKLPLISLANIYQVASVMYYQHDDPIMSDGDFDRLCKYLFDNYDASQMEGISRDDLECGTGYTVKFPKRSIYNEIINEMRLDNGH